MITVTSATFDEQVLNAPGPVLVDFWADWCPPCKMIAPILEQLDAELGDRLTIASLNGDENPDIASRYGVLGFPTLTLYKGGEVVHQMVGAKPKRHLLAALTPHL
ncbi:thioredoxin [Actinomadura montaniterrae]|uniref:Thioredoxin n=1 Tax=Actinomadura montaniterrae TaxID=1803903 RepID=A0A6L3VUL0_9ACTN|nr:thioredoxin [Actinomadura montaniterrae]KAB2377450.1 thioredoxin [Actinomadura montaniterrae]